jgi:hypothetical protein
MHSATAPAYRVSASAWKLLLVSTLFALAACTNGTPAASADTSRATHIAKASSADDGTRSVGAVSDALGQRLDQMVSTRPNPQRAAR